LRPVLLAYRILRCLVSNYGKPSHHVTYGPWPWAQVTIKEQACPASFPYPDLGHVVGSRPVALTRGGTNAGDASRDYEVIIIHPGFERPHTTTACQFMPPPRPRPQRIDLGALVPFCSVPIIAKTRSIGPRAVSPRICVAFLGTISRVTYSPRQGFRTRSTFRICDGVAEEPGDIQPHRSSWVCVLVSIPIFPSCPAVVWMARIGVDGQREQGICSAGAQLVESRVSRTITVQQLKIRNPEIGPTNLG
jgi:hypothetical protein